jgi:hypothetical protein
MHEEITFTVEKDDESEMLVASWDDPSGNGGITTQGADLKGLQEMVSEAVRCHFEEQERPRKVRLHFVTDPVLATV